VLLGGCGPGGAPAGFDVDLPDGWKNTTQRAELTTNQDFELVYEGPEEGGITASIAIVRVEAAEGATLSQIARSGQRNIGKAYGLAGADGPPVDTRLGGEPAVQLEYEAEDGRVRQVGALHAGHFYLASFTAAKTAFDHRVEAFDGLLRSWRWE
jgi:hypothetical protein